MALNGTYDPDNIFAKILRGDMPAVTVHEDDVALAFMDIFPQAKGHTLVIPKGVQARNLIEMPGDRLGSYMLRVQNITRAVAAALEPDGIVVTQFNGAPAGQTVFHLHFHIIPRWEGEVLAGHSGGKQADMDELKSLARQIAAKV
ncbi:MAG: HIT domain-containing protein [Alphaproteobacteria bacterium]|jgi:histidine triad (HIT) family protein|nr:HIT domain-containing protein [Alphaproteobacteria bacterium]